MNGKKVEILFEDEVFTDPKTGVDYISDMSFTVWADADTLEVIEKVEGVSWVYSDRFEPTRFKVYYDKRYDREFLKREVEAAILCK